MSMQLEEYWELEIKAGNKGIKEHLKTFKRGRDFLEKRSSLTGVGK